MKATINCVLCIIALLISAAPLAKIYAHPLINELSSSSSDDWIEIYNPTDTEIDLASYHLRDNSATNSLSLTGILFPHAFLSFEWASKLNNDGDIVKLVLSDETIVDSVSYGEFGELLPTGEQTLGRKNDGVSELVIFAQASEGESNNNHEIINTPTPTQIPTSTPTRTPTPTKVPVPTTETAVLSENNLAISPISSSKRVSSSFHPSSYPEIALSTSSGDVIDEKDIVKKDVLVQNAADTVTQNRQLLFIGGALLLISCGILIFLWQRKKRYTFVQE